MHDLNHSFWALYSDNGSDWMTVTGNAVWNGGSPWGYCHNDHFPGEGGGLDNQIIQGNYWQGESRRSPGPGASTAPSRALPDLRQQRPSPAPPGMPPAAIISAARSRTGVPERAAMVRKCHIYRRNVSDESSASTLYAGCESVAKVVNSESSRGGSPTIPTRTRVRDYVGHDGVLTQAERFGIGEESTNIVAPVFGPAHGVPPVTGRDAVVAPACCVHALVSAHPSPGRAAPPPRMPSLPSWHGSSPRELSGSRPTPE